MLKTSRIFLFASYAYATCEIQTDKIWLARIPRGICQICRLGSGQYLIFFFFLSLSLILFWQDTSRYLMVPGNTYVRTYVRTHARTYARTHARTHTRTHARTHARTRARASIHMFQATLPCVTASPSLLVRDSTYLTVGITKHRLRYLWCTKLQYDESSIPSTSSIRAAH